MIAAGLVDRSPLDEAIVFVTTPRINGQPAHDGFGMGPTGIGISHDLSITRAFPSLHGLRRGEILGLHWADKDLRAKTLTVSTVPVGWTFRRAVPACIVM
jgi:hypothetical protein